MRFALPSTGEGFLEPLEIRVARWARERRRALGWTLEDVSALSGCSRAVVYSVESGLGTSRLANVAAVIEALGGVMEVSGGGR